MKKKGKEFTIMWCVALQVGNRNNILQFRNIDPDLAASLLHQIEAGAEVEPLLVQLKHSLSGGQSRTRDKVVTFQEDFSRQNI